ncbi:Hypothetical protein PSM36_0131 [Proteiniphilum saccharofermentans]|jgi:hypothetical protein|uniref:Uncharacterized protein n=1 Tax=Proteiniphilum saccharofermentans TaxID=1642647 RepID=A0A1R3T3A6_9BACT|nr:Hypothetical protein PSM36_0131 [Proteiniphilum saccharofermentans]
MRESYPTIFVIGTCIILLGFVTSNPGRTLTNNYIGILVHYHIKLNIYTLLIRPIPTPGFRAPDHGNLVARL